MAKSKTIYKEPASYFNEDMKKAAEEWEKKNKAKKTRTAEKKETGKKKK